MKLVSDEMIVKFFYIFFKMFNMLVYKFAFVLKKNE